MDMKEITVDKKLLLLATGIAVASIKMLHKTLGIEAEVDTKKITELVQYNFIHGDTSAEYPYLKENGMFLRRRNVLGTGEKPPSFNELSIEVRFTYYACRQAVKMVNPIRTDYLDIMRLAEKPEPPTPEEVIKTEVEDLSAGLSMEKSKTEMKDNAFVQPGPIKPKAKEETKSQSDDIDKLLG